jgi:hypothetical protein
VEYPRLGSAGVWLSSPEKRHAVQWQSQLVRSSQASACSIADRLVFNLFGVGGRSFTVLRPRQRRIVVLPTPSSAASSATGRLLRL